MSTDPAILNDYKDEVALACRIVHTLRPLDEGSWLANEAWVQVMLEQHKAAVERGAVEKCANVAENGCFLHDDAPDARFGKACGAAIRRLALAPKESK